MNRAPSLKTEVEIAKLKVTAPLLNPRGGGKQAIGYSDKARWEATQALMAEYGGLTKRVPDYSNQFLALHLLAAIPPCMPPAMP